MSLRLPANILITGTRRGIGLSLVKEWAKHAEVKNIFACARQLEDDAELKKLIDADHRIHYIKMDVNSDRDISDAKDEVQKILGKNTGLNLLINNAGIKLESNGGTLFGADRKVFAQHFETNVTSPLKVSMGFYPLLKAASNAVNTTTELSIHRAAILNIGSLLGSITLNTNGTKIVKNIAYRLSKAALNQLTKTMAIDMNKDRILVVSVCPGWVRTEMGGPDAPTEADEAASRIVETSLTFATRHNGLFVNSKGKVYPY